MRAPTTSGPGTSYDLCTAPLGGAPRTRPAPRIAEDLRTSGTVE
ncbi:hypothetical protein [Nocardia asiatica]